VALQHLVDQIEKFLDADDARAELADSRAALATALDDVRGTATALTGYLMGSQENTRELYRVGLQSVPFLLAVGDLLIGWLLLRQAEIAFGALDQDPSDTDRDFYRGKIVAATFFAKNVLPRLSAERGIAENVDLALMEMREEAF
jgi:hypothetical protein